jgi:hypothetical protein
MTSDIESSYDYSSPQPYDWLIDPEYLPSLAEVEEAETNIQAKAAIGIYHNLAAGTGQYEIWTQEYIAGLTKYIIRTLTHYDQPDATVLEVGAGHGRLSGLLRKSIGESGVRATVIATDLQPPKKTHFPVEPLSCKKALKKYDPIMAISSWMPFGRDWSRAMRSTPSLKDYILIGVPEITGVSPTWQGYPSPELGEFAPIELDHLDRLKTPRYRWRGLDRTRAFRRYTEAQARQND